MIKVLKGYVSSRHIAGQLIPQSIQNSLIRNYCNENNMTFALSSTEYSSDNSFLMLEKTVNEIKLYDGIISYSIFQLPKSIEYRNFLLNKMLNKKKIYCSVLEKITISNKKDLNYLNQILNINNLLPHCLTEINYGN